MNADTTLKKSAESYVKSDHVKDLRARLSMSPYNRKQERKRIRDDAREHLRISVAYYQAGWIEQIMLAWTIAKWVRWILSSIFDETHKAEHQAL